jgi:MFS family permease
VISLTGELFTPNPMTNDPTGAVDRPRQGSWITAPVLGIVLATFLSDFSHEACTAVLPLYLTAIGLGPLALGIVEGIADFLVSLSKLAGGVIGHRVRHKRPWAAVGYAITGIATAGIGLVQSAGAILSLRSVAWIARGYRGPLRDSMMTDAVPPTHYGRAFGLERAGDMLGAVSGPLIAALLVWAGYAFGTIILWSILPGLGAAAAFYFLTRDRGSESSVTALREKQARPAFPARFWQFLVGVFLFGMGDFSRTFLIFLAAKALGEEDTPAGGTISLAVLLYALHNLVSAAAAYLIGHVADRGHKLRLLVVGYVLGVATNLLLALVYSSVLGIIGVVFLSGIYIAAEETLEKATAAEFLPRELRSLGFGILASTNAVGDMVSSLGVGFLLHANRAGLAFGIAAGLGLLGVLWLIRLIRTVQ